MGRDTAPAEDISSNDLATATPLSPRLVTPDDDEWPTAAVSSMEKATAEGGADLAPPWALWVRGSVCLNRAVARAVAIVGALDPTPYGA